MNNPNQETDICKVLVVPETTRRREYLIRYGSILIISLLSTWFQLDYPIGENGFLTAFLISLVRTTLIWNGSMMLIQYSVKRFSMFTQMTRLILFQVFTLVLLVLVVEAGEILAVSQLLHLHLDRGIQLGLVGASLLITFMISSIYASVSFFINWKEDLLRAQALQKANLDARYDTLRNQINPHFLFNSLNTLAMMVNDNPDASRYVESIAGIMRYMLLSRDKETVTLEEELSIAREYVYIQQKRFEEKLSVHFDVPEIYHARPIPPLTLQMLLENAIKHNEISLAYPLRIEIAVLDNQFIRVENEIRLKKDKEPSTGIGLENIRNRYLFLSGKEIGVSRDNGHFTVLLPLFHLPEGEMAG
ncbi:MAG: histidine kinase [Marinilabiliales bacterium]|nr:histidine kinase [Marinilabiliales bacterium]